MAPRTFDYVSLDLYGDTCEALLWQKVISKSDNAPTGAVARGQGGVGKTTAVCGTAYHEKIRHIFPDGVLFVKIGEQGSVVDIIKGIAVMVEYSGNSEKAKEIRLVDSPSSAVSLAAAWFQERCCLFILDDLWIVNDIIENVVDIFRNIGHHRHSRMVYVTRDSKVCTFVDVEFTSREYARSKEMLLNVAGLEVPQDSQIQVALDEILKMCVGLPIYIIMAGKALKQCSRRYTKSEAGFAFVAFLETADENIVMSSIEPIVSKSLSVASSELGQETCFECFASLRVLRNGKSVHLAVVEKLWS